MTTLEFGHNTHLHDEISWTCKFRICYVTYGFDSLYLEVCIYSVSVTCITNQGEPPALHASARPASDALDDPPKPKALSAVP